MRHEKVVKHLFYIDPSELAEFFDARDNKTKYRIDFGNQNLVSQLRFAKKYSPSLWIGYKKLYNPFKLEFEDHGWNLILTIEGSIEKEFVLCINTYL